MRLRRGGCWSGTLVATVFCLGCGESPSAIEQSATDPGIVGDDNLSAVLEEVRIRFDQPGGVAGMIVAEGSILEQAAVGLRAVGRPETVTPGDKWHIGSMGKSMTATLAAVLVERGVIRWDATLGEVFTALEMDPVYADVRLEELLSHTAGLQRDADWNWSDRASFAEYLLRLTPPPGVQRGTWSYSNAGYVLAGSMLEVATGSTWEELMQREVFDPLGMTDSGFGSPTDRFSWLQPYGHRYVCDGGDCSGLFGGGTWRWVRDANDVHPIAGPAGLVHTTLGDYAAYVAEHLAGTQGFGSLLSAESFKTLHDPQPGTDGTILPAGSAGGQYALGWAVASQADRDWIGGPALFHTGSNGRWVSEVWLIPAGGVAFVAFVNARGPGSREAAHATVEVLVARYHGALGVQ